MTVRASTPPIVLFPNAADAKFLEEVARALDRLRAASEVRGHNLLASLISIAEGAAEDGLRTQLTNLSVLEPEPEPDGVEMMAQKLAFRAGRRG